MESTFCPKCNTHLIIPNNLKNKSWIKCSNCKTSFENPNHYSEPNYYYNPQPKNYNSSNKNNNPSFEIPLGIKIILGVLLLAIIVVNADFKSNSSNDETELTTDIQSNATVLLKVQYLKDPDSYESISWSEPIKLDENTFQVIHKYRAKNGFGGYTVEEALIYYNTKGDITNIECIPEY